MSHKSKKKQRIYNRMHTGMMSYYANTMVELTPGGHAFLDDVEKAGGIEKYIEQMPRVTQWPPVITVVRKKDNEVFGRFETREEAEAVIEKARKAKRAALVILG